MNIDKMIDEIISEILNNKEEKTCFRGKNLIDDLDFDSIMVIRLIVELENTFDIIIEDEEIELEILCDYDNLVDFIKNKIEVK